LFQRSQLVGAVGINLLPVLQVNLYKPHLYLLPVIATW
jgi:hypothetical protein